ncbi:type I-D CRISPR-associated protein Cas7/Csc2 [Haloferax sulfurifontis]|uniref:CRISPR-associated protein Csc2 n=1 Tax=Haloferax sulfurifontis ATCC BAA-897 TaxID=662480 RepID=M0IKR4_9EURY|nr:type I-D CRISPR-associated protein Cas7/Csc2 [Haloferax sulfurifontis]ELZ96024.1 CRISPR-associated protein Csc2 [Haloferax sulfurifontis ATCC BAA-897]
MFDHDTYPELERGTVSRDEMTIAPKNNFTNVLVLRELESHAVFTTDGQSADLANVAVGLGDDRETYSPGLMFMRKQTGSDRRFGKSLQRDLLQTECTMQVNGMCQDCVECILYGSAASDDADQQLSITSRVMYDTAYTLRDATVTIDEKFQNAPGDDYAKTAEATIREPDFFEPGTLFPSVITLRDATPEELAFVLGITAKNKRYGAATSRLGRVKNHILGVYTGSEEGPANLGLTRDVVTRLRDSDETSADSIQDVITAAAHDPQLVGDHLQSAFDDRVNTERGGLDLERVPDDTVDDLLETATSDSLADVLETQLDASRAFLEQTG